MPSSNKLTGRWGEDRAAEFLKKKGYKIIGRNFTCRMGEIDIIAEKGRYIAFVEVKTRKNDAFATAAEFVTASKQRRVAVAAELWLGQNPTKKQPRFDVVEVYAPQGVLTAKPDIRHLEDAFGL